MSRVFFLLTCSLLATGCGRERSVLEISEERKTKLVASLPPGWEVESFSSNPTYSEGLAVLRVGPRGGPAYRVEVGPDGPNDIWQVRVRDPHFRTDDRLADFYFFPDGREKLSHSTPSTPEWLAVALVIARQAKDLVKAIRDAG